MATVCPYCNIEVRESLIEAEDGCCPECGAVISASGSYLEQFDPDYDENEFDIYESDFDDDDDDNDDDIYERSSFETEDIFEESFDDEFEDDEFSQEDEDEDIF